MTRGLGKTQRRVLAALDEVGIGDARSLAEYAYDTFTPTESQRVATSRALSLLHDRHCIVEAAVEARGTVWAIAPKDEIEPVNRGARRFKSQDRKETPCPLTS